MSINPDDPNNEAIKICVRWQPKKPTKKEVNIQWAIKKFGLSTILYYTRRKDWLVSLRNKAPGAFTARWFNGFGWGFIGYGLKII